MAEQGEARTGEERDGMAWQARVAWRGSERQGQVWQARCGKDRNGPVWYALEWQAVHGSDRSGRAGLGSTWQGRQGDGERPVATRKDGHQ